MADLFAGGAAVEGALEGRVVSPVVSAAAAAESSSGDEDDDASRSMCVESGLPRPAAIAEGTVALKPTEARRAELSLPVELPLRSVVWESVRVPAKRGGGFGGRGIGAPSGEGRGGSGRSFDRSFPLLA